jgi:hypothetical protein
MSVSLFAETFKSQNDAISGSDQAAKSIQLQTTNSTGSGTQGSISFWAGQKGTTGSTSHSVAKVAQIKNARENTTESTAAAVGQLDLFYGTKSVAIKPSTHGDFAASYTLTLPTTDGSSNQVLKTDGSGVLSWGSASGMTYSENTDGNILTATGTADTIEGETKLRFLVDSRSLIVGDGTNESTTIKLGGSSGKESISTGDNAQGIKILSSTDVADAVHLHASTGTSQTIYLQNTAGTSESAIALTATAGGITAKVADEKNLTLGNADGDAYFKVAASATAENEDVRVVNTNGTDEAAIALTAIAGGVDIDASQGKDVHISGGQVTLVSKANTNNAGLASAISLTTPAGVQGGAADTIVVTNTQGTDEAAITLAATAGGVDVDAAQGKDVHISGGQVTLVSKANTNNAGLANAISLTTPAGVQGGAADTIVVTNTQGTDEAAIAITASAGGVDVDAAQGKDVHISGGQVALVSKDNAVSAITLTANVGTDETIVVTNNKGTSESAITLNAVAGGVDIDAAATKNITIAGGQVALGSKENVASAISLTTDQGTSETMVFVNIQGTSESAITLAATNGGVDIDAADTKDVNIAGGQVALVSKDNATSAISLTTNVGTGETIVVTNNKGNTESAITLNATLGGVDIDAAAGKDINIAGGTVTLVSKSDGDISITPNGTGLVSLDGFNVFQDDTNSLYVGKAERPSGQCDYNVGIGLATLAALTAGDNNVAIGYNAGSTITTGANNIVLGYNATASAATANNEVTLGNSSVGTLRCGTNTITSISDQRDKTNVLDINYGLDFLNTLRPVEFEWQMRELTEADKNSSKNGKKQVGFLAQELQSAMSGNQNETLNLVYESNPERLEISPGHLIPILVKAVQELKEEVEVLKAAAAN